MKLNTLTFLLHYFHHLSTIHYVHLTIRQFCYWMLMLTAFSRETRQMLLFLFLRSLPASNTEFSASQSKFLRLSHLDTCVSFTLGLNCSGTISAHC